MDDQQQNQNTVPPMPNTDAISSMNDVASMTPPPAPVMPSMPANDQTQGMTPPPVAPMDTMSATMPVVNPMAAADSQSASVTAPVDPMPSTRPNQNPTDDDYSYAEDVLNEILDSLDRIEAKLDAMEKKQG